jgi:carbon storage regulator CsrA
MLVLSRKIGEQITIGGDVRVVVLRVAAAAYKLALMPHPQSTYSEANL